MRLTESGNCACVAGSRVLTVAALRRAMAAGAAKSFLADAGYGEQELDANSALMELDKGAAPTPGAQPPPRRGRGGAVGADPSPRLWRGGRGGCVVPPLAARLSGPGPRLGCAPGGGQPP